MKTTVKMSTFPSSQRRGGAARREPDRAKPQEKRRRGGQFGTNTGFCRSDHPVCAFAPLGASTPPLRGGECYLCPVVGLPCFRLVYTASTNISVVQGPVVAPKRSS